MPLSPENRKFVVLVCAVLVACLPSTSACSGGSPASPTPAAPAVKTYAVEYRVTKLVSYPPGTVSLTYENPSGGTSQISRAEPPWSLRFSGGTGKFVYVSAQNDGGIYVSGVNISAGLTYVDILLDGQVWKRSSASGNFAIGSASGSLP